jgi:hypothetical protein
VKFESLRGIAAAIATRDPAAAIAAIDAALIDEPGRNWRRDLGKLRATLEDRRPRFGILARDGNSKLPFLAFSSLPGVGFCPGAGACLEFCYSFRAWRYPAAFARQAQNAFLMQSAAGRAHILQALDQHAPGDGSALDFRLYVDGDFGNVADVRFWFTAIAARPWLRAYGYSKSWREILAYKGALPENYRLNLSSGSKHGTALESRVAALPITRGRFIAVKVPYKVTSAMHGDRAHQATLRAAHASKAFTCPGKCGECTPKGHACGSSRFAGLDIIIATH